MILLEQASAKLPKSKIGKHDHIYSRASVRSYRQSQGRNAAKTRLHQYLGGLFICTVGFLMNGVHTAHALELSLPLACRYGEDCVIQHYVDWGKTTPEDYRCGSQTSPNKTGTDFRVLDLAHMEKGVAVTAAARGVVLAVRDGMADITMGTGDAADIAGRECGNGVIIDHGDGWSTQYCHLKKGSLAAEPKTTVEAGQKLGEVGLSGATSFPHLEFVVRRDKRIIDPFTGPAGRKGCEMPTAGLWREDVANSLTYEPVRTFAVGFSATEPSLEGINADTTSPDHLSPNDERLFFWARVLGLKPQHSLHLRVVTPGGEVLIDGYPNPVESAKAEWVSWTGRRRPAEGWAEGEHIGIVTIRDGPTVITRDAARILIGTAPQSPDETP